MNVEIPSYPSGNTVPAQLTDTEKNPGWEAIDGNILKEIAGGCGPGFFYLVGAVPGCVHWVVRVATDSGPADPTGWTEWKHCRALEAFRSSQLMVNLMF